MKKILLLLFLCSLSAQVFAQPAEVAAKKIRATEKLSVSGTEVTTIRTAAVDATATNAQLPTAKSVWDALAAFVTTVTTDATLSGAGTSGSPLGIAQQGATTGRVLRWNGTSWVPAQVDAASLVNTGASAGSYTAPSITIGPDGRIYTISSGAAGGDLTGPITNLQLIAGAVQTADISNNAISADKIGTGQVTGIKLAQDGATTGQVWKWNGTQWAPGADLGTTYTGGTGISVVGTTITNTAPDQTITISGATGSYPSFTLPDNSATNEIELPSQSGNSGKYLTTNGTAPSWADVTGGGITGSGANTRVPVWSGTGTQTSYASFIFPGETQGLVVGGIQFNGFGTNVGWTGSGFASAGSNRTMRLLAGSNTNASDLYGAYYYFGTLTNRPNPSWIGHEFTGQLQSNNSAALTTFTSIRNNPIVQHSLSTLIGYDYNPQGGDAGITNHYAALFRFGRIGVGNSAALAKMHITGEGGTSGTYSFIVTPNGVSTSSATIASNDAGNTGFGTNLPQKRGHFVGNIRITDLDTDGAAPTTSGTTRMVITDANGDLSFAPIPATGITGTAAANAVPYWNAGATALTTGGMTKDATNLNLESGLGLKVVSTGAANMVLNATTTAGAIQTYGSVPLKLNPLGNGIYLGGITGGAGKAVSIATDGLLGVIDVGSGTVTSTSVATANGFSGSVATATTTPVITLSTTITGLLKGNGTAISAATAGTDYVTPSMTANQTVNTGNFAFILDASTASSVISNPLTIKGKADGSNSTQAITFQNAAGTAQSTVTVTNVGTYFSAVSGKNLILGVGTTGFSFRENGALQFQNLSVNPTAAGNRGGLFYNSTSDRFVYSDGTNNSSLAKLSDIAGSNSTYVSSQTLGASVSTVEADANSGAITITVDGTMSPDFPCLIRATRNNTNAVTITAGSGYVLKVDGDAAVTATTYPLTAGEIVTVRRNGTVIFVNK